MEPHEYLLARNDYAIDYRGHQILPSLDYEDAFDVLDEDGDEALAGLESEAVARAAIDTLIAEAA